MECEQQAWEEHFSIEGFEEEQEEVTMWAGLCEGQWGRKLSWEGQAEPKDRVSGADGVLMGWRPQPDLIWEWVRKMETQP